MRAAATLLAIALAAAILAPAAQAQAGPGIEDRVLELYIEAYRLARRGVDVTSVVHELDRALRLARMGEEGEALRLLEEASRSLDRLSARAGGMLLRARLEKYLAVAVLASIPVATYLLLPRLYMGLWYRSRRRWVVEGED